MGVTDEEQASMAIKLADNVRQLIRDEVKAALEDPAFMASMTNTHPLMDAAFRSAGANHAFIHGVKKAIVDQMHKY
jgi:hypothetical protein